MSSRHRMPRGTPKATRKPLTCRTTPTPPKSSPPTRQRRRRTRRPSPPRLRPRRRRLRRRRLRRRRLRRPPRPPRFDATTEAHRRIGIRRGATETSTESAEDSTDESEPVRRQAADQLATRSRLRRTAGPCAVARAGRRVLPVGVRVERLRCAAARRIGAKSFSGTRIDERGQGQHDQDVVVQAGHRRSAAQLRPRPAHR